MALTQLEPVGLSVTFQDKEQFTAIHKLDLHKQMGFKLLFESQEMHLHLVAPEAGRVASARSFEDGCRKYRRLPMVRFCKVEYRISKK